MEILLWGLVLAVAIVVMVGGGDVFLKNAEVVGLRIGLSSFTIGVIIVGFGTSLPELTSALLAVVAHVPTLVAANAIGSNIANILLIGGVLAYVGKRLTIDHDLLDTELPFFVISTALFFMIAFDGKITQIESVLLASTFLVYVVFLFSRDYSSGTVVEAVREDVQHERFRFFKLSDLKTALLLIVGLVGLLVGAKYVVDAAVALATALSVPPGVISITAVAIGTSLPELVVSLRALKANKLSLAIGNIFGSNAFNILMAVGIPGLFTMLPLDTPTFAVGLPMLLVSSFIFLIIGLARKLYRWEGLMFFLVYIFFMLQIVSDCCTP
jgi:cation:H+ antiporter